MNARRTSLTKAEQALLRKLQRLTFSVPISNGSNVTWRPMPPRSWSGRFATGGRCCSSPLGVQHSLPPRASAATLGR